MNDAPKLSRCCGFVGLYLAPIVPNHNPIAVIPVVAIAFKIIPVINCMMDQPKKNVATTSTTEMMISGNNQLIQNFPYEICLPDKCITCVIHKFGPSRPIEDDAIMPFANENKKSKMICAIGQEISLQLLISLIFNSPPPVINPITPKTMKNKIGKSVNHSRKSC